MAEYGRVACWLERNPCFGRLGNCSGMVCGGLSMYVEGSEKVLSM